MSKPKSQNSFKQAVAWRDVLPVHPAADLFPMTGAPPAGHMSEDRVAEQADTQECTIESIMRSKNFAAGVRDVRAGDPPRFDELDDWSYERGRLWAMLAPMSMPLRVGCKLNPKAVMLFYQHLEDIP